MIEDIFNVSKKMRYVAQVFQKPMSFPSTNQQCLALKKTALKQITLVPTLAFDGSNTTDRWFTPVVNCPTLSDYLHTPIKLFTDIDYWRRKTGEEKNNAASIESQAMDQKMMSQLVIFTDNV